MLAGSVTIAISFRRPWHLGQARTSTPNVRARSCAHPRYPPAPFGVSGSVVGPASGGLGAMRDLNGLAEASTPAYLTVWTRGPASRARRRAWLERPSPSTRRRRPSCHPHGRSRARAQGSGPGRAPPLRGGKRARGERATAWTSTEFLSAFSGAG